ncbi:FAD binding domain-containing protein [Apiospora rasikravindrae]|uniref:FAD binding domain-containing protein n=1 Tax=Apiospora rasikravindrae TaxID=990691 RepID=A0ABR1SF65_9PEZI
MTQHVSQSLAALQEHAGPELEILTQNDGSHLQEFARRWTDIGRETPAAIVLPETKGKIEKTATATNPQLALSSKLYLRSLRKRQYRGRHPYFLGGGASVTTSITGFGSDQILSARMVDAMGSSITEVTGEKQSDLLWAIRGAGQFFGLVTELTIKICPLSDLAATIKALYGWEGRPRAIQNTIDGREAMAAKGDFNCFGVVGLRRFDVGRFLQTVDIWKRPMEECPDAINTAFNFQWDSKPPRLPDFDSAIQIRPDIFPQRSISMTGFGKPDSVDRLLLKGYTKRMRTRWCDTSLHQAVRAVSPEVVRDLADADTDVDAQNKYRASPICYTTAPAGDPAYKAYARPLLEVGTDTEIPDYHGRMILIWAAIHDRTALTRCLLGHGARLSAEDI